MGSLIFPSKEKNAPKRSGWATFFEILVYFATFHVEHKKLAPFKVVFWANGVKEKKRSILGGV